jgi:hypothetical protein
MPAVDEVNELIGRYHQALDEFVRGNPEPVKDLFSRRDDVTFANPLVGLPVSGWEQVAEALEHASSQFEEGSEIVGIESVGKYVTSELAYVTEIERAKAKVNGREDIAPFALRVTMVFRPEGDTWKVVHRHADPITSPQPAEWVLQQ